MQRPCEQLAFLAALCVIVCGALGAETGTLSVLVHEPDSASPLPSRAWVQAGAQRIFEPTTPSCTPYARDRSFSSEGRFALTLPAGTALLHVERGKEYRPVDREVAVGAGETVEVDVTLERWTHMAAEGWYSTDLHCHFGVHDLPVLKQLALADDVNLEPILTLWNHQRDGLSDESWPDWPHAPNVFADPTHLVTLRNQEIERIGGGPFESVGALLMFGLQTPVKMPPRNSRYPCDAVLARMAKNSSPHCIIDTDKPIWAENVVGVALGLFDCVQVCHNHYHRDSTLPLGWGMATVDEPEQESWGPDELFHRTNRTYHRFLNCGFKLAATGGTAMGVMPAPLGYCRTYAKLDGPLTEASYLKAIASGRTFATSGPMLTLTAAGKDVGAEIRYSTQSRASIPVKALLRSIQPIDRLELIYNGRIIKGVDLKDQPASPTLRRSVTMDFAPTRSGWIAARALFVAPDGCLRQAHTSPVYITVDDKPTASRQDAEFMIRWLDRIAEIARQPDRYDTTDQTKHTLTLFQKARKVYENIAAQPSAETARSRKREG